MNEYVSGIDKSAAHPKAIELVDEEWFWSDIDEIAPFGSDEGDTGLEEYRRWRKENPNAGLIHAITWVIESVGEIKSIEGYNEDLLNEELLEEQINDPNFDDRQFLWTLDISIISTAFGQLVDEGFIDDEVKKYIQLAIDRQQIMATLLTDWPHNEEYKSRLEKTSYLLRKSLKIFIKPHI